MQYNQLTSLLFLLVFPLICFGQNTSRKEIKGKLLAAEDNMFLETVYVYNKQSGSGILSDASGNFKLAMRQGDTIAVSAMHIAPSELLVERMHINDAFVTLAVASSMEYLTEVRLTNRSLTGNLDLDMKRLAITPIISSADLGFPVSSTEITHGQRLLSSATGGPAELLFAALSGELKMIKRRMANEVREGQIQYIYKRMPVSFYTANLNIKEENIPHFIDFCESEKNLNYISKIPIDEFVELLQAYAICYKDAYPERF